MKTGSLEDSDNKKKKSNLKKENIFAKTKKPVNKRKKKKIEEIILQLPITLLDLKEVKKDKDTVKSSSLENNDDNIFTITDVAHSSSEDKDVNSELLLVLEKKDMEIKNLKEQLNQLLKRKCYVNGTNDRRLYPMNLKFVSSISGKQVVTNKTDIECWWDRKTFDTVPCFLVDKIYKNIYYVLGCFCSFNCAVAYNTHWINDDRVSERYSLTKDLYNKLYKNNDNIESADPWHCLKGPGGHQTIEEFRESNIVCEKRHKLLMPPLAYIVPMLEEEYLDKIDKSKKIKKTNTSDSTDSAELVLKRKKPLVKSNHTLMESMGLEIEKPKKKKKKKFILT